MDGKVLLEPGHESTLLLCVSNGPGHEAGPNKTIVIMTAHRIAQKH